MPNGFVIYVDIEKCLGCLSCYFACAVEHSLTKNPYTAFREIPTPIPRTRIIPVLSYNVPIRCMHCEKPPCVEICPTDALQKTPEGPVLLREPLCIGCKGCILACPYGAITLDLVKKVIVKCDFCSDRIKKGLLPACVEACPTKALRYGKIEEVLLERHEKKAKEFVTGLTGLPGSNMILYSTPPRR
jgi:carbon-monoxide dehydrogenase iron sulfur subunit